SAGLDDVRRRGRSCRGIWVPDSRRLFVIIITWYAPGPEPRSVPPPRRRASSGRHRSTSRRDDAYRTMRLRDADSEIHGASRPAGDEMAARPPNILICSCEDTMPLDGSAVRLGCRGAEVATARQLCRAELEKFRAAAAGGEPLIVGCTQEAPLFSEVAGSADVTYANIRETAGWSKDAHAAGPKMAALLAAAAEPTPEVPFVSLNSEGVILVYGRDEQAIEAGNLLKDHLDVTVVMTAPAEVAPRRVTDFPVVKGSIRSAKGYLGAFELTVDGYAQPAPSSRGILSFAAPRDGAVSRCDLVLD